MEMDKTALVFRHIHQETLGSFEEVLWQRGFEIEYFSTPRQDFADIDPMSADLLIVMGGPCGVYQTEEYPFLENVIDIVKQRLAADKPVFGVCLGAQIMARALGAKVYPGASGQEIGWGSIELTEAGKGSAIEHIAADKTKMVQWHGDTFDLPDGAILLASSAQYPHQVFSYGENALGVQCHPEVTGNLLQEWFVMFVGQITGPNPVVPVAQLRAETEQYADTLKTQGRKFFDAWLGSIGL